MKNLLLPLFASLAMPALAFAGIKHGDKDLNAIWCVGDSITQSNLDSDPNGSPRKALHDLLKAKGYAFTFTGHFAANPDGLSATGATPAENLYQFHSGVSGAVIGDGVKGRTGISQSIPAWWNAGRLATAKPNLVLIMLGTNDMNSNIEVATAPARLQAMVKLILSQPGAGQPTFLISTLPPNRTTPAATARTEAYNRALPEVVAALKKDGVDVSLVDAHTPIERDYATTMRADNLHPIAAGNQIIAETWLKEIESRTGPIKP